MRAILAVALLGLLGAGCKPDLPVEPDPSDGLTYLEVMGTWSYSATDVRLTGTPLPGPCTISGVTLKLTSTSPSGEFTGRASGGKMECTGPLALFSGTLPDLPVGRGHTFNQFMAFDMGSPDWRHAGFVSTTDSIAVDSMHGTFKMDNGGIELEGSFRMIPSPSNGS